MSLGNCRRAYSNPKNKSIAINCLVVAMAGCWFELRVWNNRAMSESNELINSIKNAPEGLGGTCLQYLIHLNSHFF